MFSAPPFQGSRFVGCSWALLPLQFPVGAAASALISEHPSGLQHPPGLAWGWGTEEGGAGGAGAGSPPRRVPSPSRYSGVSGDRCWWGSAFPSAASSATLEFTGGFLWHRAPRSPARRRRPAPGLRTEGVGAAAAEVCLSARARHPGCSGTSGHWRVQLGPLSPKTLWREQWAVAPH